MSDDEEELILYDFIKEEATDLLDMNKKLCISCQRHKPIVSFGRYTHCNNVFNSNKYVSIGQLNFLNSEVCSVSSQSSTETSNLLRPSPTTKSPNEGQTVKKTLTETSPLTSQVQLLSPAQPSYNSNDSTANNNQFKFKLENLCDSCWFYWKKYGEFKFTYYYDMIGSCLERPCPQKRQERINAIKSQLYKCQIDSCLREFKTKEELVTHSMVAHCMILKKPLLTAKHIYKPLHNYCMSATALTRAARHLFGDRYFKKMAKRSIKQTVDFESIKNKCKFIVLYFIFFHQNFSKYFYSNDEF
jgi:hypothetical protein